MGIYVKETDELIGFGSIIYIDWINKSDHCPSMIGDRKYWSKGYGSEARLLLLDFAFNERGFDRIWDLIRENNIASKRMCEKCGYKTEGVLRQSIYKNGKFQNQIIMSILQEEFYQMLKDRGIE